MEDKSEEKVRVIISSTFHMYPDHKEGKLSSKGGFDREGMFLVECPDCGSNVFTIRASKWASGKLNFYGNCIYCDHQCELGSYDPNEEEHQ